MKEVERLEKEIYGNGNTGIKERVGKLESIEMENKKTFEEIRSALETNYKLVSSLSDYRTKDELKNALEEKYRKERKNDKKFTIVQTISIISLVITILYYIFLHN